MKHSYKIKVEWVGNQGLGTVNYNANNRNYLITSDEKPESIKGSSDSAFLRDQKRYNPEEPFYPPYLLATCCGICTYVQCIESL